MELPLGGSPSGHVCFEDDPQGPATSRGTPRQETGNVFLGGAGSFVLADANHGAEGDEPNALLQACS